MSTADEMLRDLVYRVEHPDEPVTIIISEGPWPAEYAGQSSYVDAEGMLHFTLRLDRPYNSAEEDPTDGPL